ncbi:MAG: alanine:cation symporter family protein, partial [Roseibacillus sp.]|nr:alanine:cation symporter family protein [Roseibacillus sp.]
MKSGSFSFCFRWLLLLGVLLFAVTGIVSAQEDNATTAPPVAEEAKSMDERINEIMAPVTDWVFKFVFVSVEIPAGKDKTIDLPLILLWLVGAALLFTLTFRFINLRAFGLAFRTIKGKYSSPDDPGEISHFQALTAALSATVGLGNIAGVAIAVSLGGPGAVFWMILAGFLGMTSKFAECTLGVKYRTIVNGKVFGGPMYYLRDGFKERDMQGL